MLDKPVRMKVTEAAKILGIDPENLRIGIRNGDYSSFAVATKTSSHYTYIIIRKKFFDFIGTSEDSI